MGVTVRIELGLITFREVVNGPFFGEDIMLSALPFANDNTACIGVSVGPVETCLPFVIGLYLGRLARGLRTRGLCAVCNMQCTEKGVTTQVVCRSRRGGRSAPSTPTARPVTAGAEFC